MTEPMPAIQAKTMMTNMTYLSHEIAFEYEYLFFFVLNRAIKSCIIPNGHIIEQYMRPNSSVISIKTATITTFKARRAGKNWIFAIHAK